MQLLGSGLVGFGTLLGSLRGQRPRLKERQGKTYFSPEMVVKWLKWWNFQEDLQSKQALGLMMMMMMMMMMIDDIFDRFALYQRGLMKRNTWSFLR